MWFAGTPLATPFTHGLNQERWYMVTRDQAINCINRVRRIEELKTRAERTQELPPDYPLLALMLQQLKRRESLLMAELTPEERQQVREQIRQQQRGHDH
jgi:hypothetical protein